MSLGLLDCYSCFSALRLAMIAKRCASSGRSELSFIHEISGLLSAQYCVTAGAAPRVRKLTARCAKWQVHAGSCKWTSENTPSTHSGE